MAKLKLKDYITIFIVFILFMGFLALYYVGGDSLRLILKYIAIGFMAGGITTFIFMIGKEK